MTHPIRAAAVVLALGVFAAGPALAQSAPGSAATGGAAATLPNTFARPATPGARQPAASPVANAQVAETALRGVIEQLREGDLDETMFTADVAARLNTQLATYAELIQSYGALESVETQDVSNGVGQFLVIFENAATQWQVGLEDGGLIAALRFREAPPESSEPPPAGS